MISPMFEASSRLSVIDGLKRLYQEKLKPLEVTYRFNDFVSPLLTHSDFDKKPMVVVLGQNSTEKSTFVKYLSTLTDQITFVDTAEKIYDYTCDLILLVFDPRDTGLVNDEFARQLSFLLRGQEVKLRIILKNAEKVDALHLHDFFGGLVWPLSKILRSPELPRAYFGSFCENPVHEVGSSRKQFYEGEEAEFLTELIDLPNKISDSRLANFLKRANDAKIHAYIISELKKEMPVLMSTINAQKKVVKNLEQVFKKVQVKFGVTADELPDVAHYRRVLGYHNIAEFEKLKPNMIQAVDYMVQHDIPNVLRNHRE